MLGAVAVVGLLALFGDNIRSLFAMSTELAGETSVRRRRDRAGEPAPTLKDRRLRDQADAGLPEY